MFAMIRQFFAMFSSLFSAGEKLANGLNHAASFVEGEAAGFNERTSLARSQELKKLRAMYTVEDRELAAADAISARDLDKTLRETAVKQQSKTTTKAAA
jgi:hypothetical protein